MKIIKKRVKECWNYIRGVLKNDIVHFRLLVIFKITSIPIVTMILLSLFLLILLELNLIFFEVNGYLKIDALREAYFDYILSVIGNLIVYIGFFILLNVGVGIFIANILLRTFKMIGNYCENYVNGVKEGYNLEFFTDFKLLTGMSEYFFNIMENFDSKSIIMPIEIPSRFQRIHSPVFERGFFIQYAFILIISSMATGMAIYVITQNIHNQMIQDIFS